MKPLDTIFHVCLRPDPRAVGPALDPRGPLGLKLNLLVRRVIVREIIVFHAAKHCSDTIGLFDLFDQNVIDGLDLVVLVRGKHVFNVLDCFIRLLLLVVCHCLVGVDGGFAPHL